VLDSQVNPGAEKSAVYPGHAGIERQHAIAKPKRVTWTLSAESVEKEMRLVVKRPWSSQEHEDQPYGRHRQQGELIAVNRAGLTVDRLLQTHHCSPSARAHHA
jgi:hypothetical protein